MDLVPRYEFINGLTLIAVQQFSDVIGRLVAAVHCSDEVLC